VTRTPDGLAKLSLPVQAGLFRRQYPASRAELTPDRLVWIGRLTPTEYSATYDVLVDHQLAKTPIVYVVSPALRTAGGADLPHVHGWNTLCLYLGEREWSAAAPIADTLIPWAVEWLAFYELWLATEGEWHGDGIHPDGAAINRTARRTVGRQLDTKLKRLSSALRVAYGTHADIDALMANARVSPRTSVRPWLGDGQHQ
jgi:hypothetical protein